MDQAVNTGRIAFSENPTPTVTNATSPRDPKHRIAERTTRPNVRQLTLNIAFAFIPFDIRSSKREYNRPNLCSIVSCNNWPKPLRGAPTEPVRPLQFSSYFTLTNSSLVSPLWFLAPSFVTRAKRASGRPSALTSDPECESKVAISGLNGGCPGES